MNKEIVSLAVAVYVISTIWISLYGYHSLALAILYLTGRNERKEEKPTSKDERENAALPRVTVQLPIFNEKYVVRRLLKAISQLDYPLGLLQIQVLDDSTDDTAALVSGLVADYQERGFDITSIHRRDRSGFKAGALQNAMQNVNGEFIAIFDADFIPPRNWLRRMLPHFADGQIGCVQSRWGHLNMNDSGFTKTVALALDGHFRVEQPARSDNSLIMGFNGSGGMWRKACIEDAGGWSADTLTEDLDLSYRAQMRGWQVNFVGDLVVPAELPDEVAAFKQQQYRWAKGGIQTARKILPDLWRSDLPFSARLMGTLHLTAYFGQLLMILILFSFLPVGLYAPQAFQIFPLTILASVGPTFLYAVTRTECCDGWLEKIGVILRVLLVGFGMSLNTSVAILDALLSKDSGTFVRTPKINTLGYTHKSIDRSYIVKISPMVLGELFLALLAFYEIYRLLPKLGLFGVAWLFLYAAGYLYIAGLNLYQEWQINRQVNGKPKGLPSGNVQ
jgi:cellulose synthase/poly-beta-1,6-N-acetylglucosamine synthase-like glycosyltransferase